MNRRLLEALAARPILLDGAMGTRLIARGLELADDDPAFWVVDHPLVVLAIHRMDVESGSEAVLSNTFGANRVWLDKFGRADEARRVNLEAVALARQAAGADRFVIGSIGPTASDEPSALREQAEALVEAGVDALILETHQLDPACSALKLLRELPTPMIASLFAWPEPVADAARRLIDHGAAILGANCLPLSAAVELARRLEAVTDHPLLMKPSAGRPGSPLETPRAFAEAARELVGHEVRLLGGCCGTTQAHVAAIRLAVDDMDENSSRSEP